MKMRKSLLFSLIFSSLLWVGHGSGARKDYGIKKAEIIQNGSDSTHAFLLDLKPKNNKNWIFFESFYVNSKGDTIKQRLSYHFRVEREIANLTIPIDEEIEDRNIKISFHPYAIFNPKEAYGKGRFNPGGEPLDERIIRIIKNEKSNYEISSKE